MQADEGFARELAGAMASAAHHSRRPQKQFTEPGAADLYIWLMDC